MEEASAATPNALEPGRIDSLPEWMRRQYSLSAAALPRSISAVHLVKDRQAFGQIIRPAKGSVLASPVIASYDPDPDYFFHWLRDSALAMDAVRLLIVDGTLTAAEGIAHFKDFIAFNARLEGLDGAAFLAEAGDFRQKVDPAFLQYVRPDDDLRRIKGERLLGEPRFNPDGTLDILKWSRPQHDGAALRALSLMRFQKLDAIDDKETSARIDALIRRDLDFAYRHWRDPSFDIWEEELGWHYYTQLVQRAALADGAEWMEGAGEFDRAKALREAAREAAQSLDAYWSPLEGFYRSRLGDPAETSQKDLDIAVALAVIHADRKEGAHSPLDPKALATLVRLEDLFAAAYPINQGADDDLAPALGRYAGDRYYSGGAYYFSTLGAAQFYYRLAEAARRAPIPIAPENRDIVERLGAAFLTDGAQAQDPQARLHGALLRRGDQFMATIRAYAPASGELAEQFDQATGAPASAKSLTWSHAAFITAFASRGAALGSPPLGATK